MQPHPSITNPVDALCHHEFPDRSLCAATALPDSPYCPTHPDDGETEPPRWVDTAVPAPRRARRFPGRTTSHPGGRG
jgi:hypothetical protein